MEAFTYQQQALAGIKKSDLKGAELVSAIKGALKLPLDPNYVPEETEKQKRAKAIQFANDWMVEKFDLLTLEKKVQGRDRFVLMVESYIKDYQEEPKGASDHIRKWSEDIDERKASQGDQDSILKVFDGKIPT